MLHLSCGLLLFYGATLMSSMKDLQFSDTTLGSLNSYRKTRLNVLQYERKVFRNYPKFGFES